MFLESVFSTDNSERRPSLLEYAEGVAKVSTGLMDIDQQGTGNPLPRNAPRDPTIKFKLAISGQQWRNSSTQLNSTVLDINIHNPDIKTRAASIDTTKSSRETKGCKRDV